MWLDEHHHRDIALVTRAGTCSYADLYRDISERMRVLRGLDDGIVVLTASMTVDFVATLLALLSLGRPAAVFSPSWTTDERDARRALVGFSVELDAQGSVTRQWHGAPVPVHPLARLILFTTGSTGQPKAVQLSESNIRSNTRAVIEALAFRTADTQTLFLPLSYSYGLLGQLLPALERGMRTDLVARLVDLSDGLVAQTIQGMISGVPSHYETILRMVPPGYACHRLSHIVTAGAYSSPDLRRRLHQAFPDATIYNNYGQTEASPRILCFTSAHPLFYSPATGYPVGDLRVRCSESGELLVGGSQVMLGYLGDAEGTRDKMSDGWLATGDLASIAEDGLVTITGRIDELVNVGGERTSAIEIESAIRRVNGVRNVAVLIVSDDLYGVACIAYVEVVGSDVTEDEILGALRRLVSPHKIPRELHVIPALPLNPHGKVDKTALTTLYRRPTPL
jgi:long-chain acyl-CoA synthetase